MSSHVERLADSDAGSSCCMYVLCHHTSRSEKKKKNHPRKSAHFTKYSKQANNNNNITNFATIEKRHSQQQCVFVPWPKNQENHSNSREKYRASATRGRPRLLASSLYAGEIFLPSCCICTMATHIC